MLVLVNLSSPFFRAILVFRHPNSIPISIYPLEVHLSSVSCCDIRCRIANTKSIVITIKNRGLNSAFTVRKISHGTGVERVFQTHSPLIDSVTVVRREIEQTVVDANGIDIVTRDYEITIDASALPWEPQAGDVIYESAGGRTIRWEVVAFGRRSPASCSMVNSSNG